MQTYSVGQPQVAPRCRIVEAPTGRGGEPLGEPSHRRLAREAHRGAGQALSPVDPDVVRPVDQHVSDRRIVQHGGQRTRALQLVPQRPQGGQNRLVAEHRTLGPDRGCEAARTTDRSSRHPRAGDRAPGPTQAASEPASDGRHRATSSAGLAGHSRRATRLGARQEPAHQPVAEPGQRAPRARAPGRLTAVEGGGQPGLGPHRTPPAAAPARRPPPPHTARSATVHGPRPRGAARRRRSRRPRVPPPRRPAPRPAPPGRPPSTERPLPRRLRRACAAGRRRPGRGTARRPTAPPPPPAGGSATVSSRDHGQHPETVHGQDGGPQRRRRHPPPGGSQIGPPQPGRVLEPEHQVETPTQRVRVDDHHRAPRRAAASPRATDKRGGPSTTSSTDDPDDVADAEQPAGARRPGRRATPRPRARRRAGRRRGRRPDRHRGARHPRRPRRRPPGRHRRDEPAGGAGARGRDRHRRGHRRPTARTGARPPRRGPPRPRPRRPRTAEGGRPAAPPNPWPRAPEAVEPGERGVRRQPSGPPRGAVVLRDGRGAWRAQGVGPGTPRRGSAVDQRRGWGGGDGPREPIAHAA